MPCSSVPQQVVDLLLVDLAATLARSVWCVSAEAATVTASARVGNTSCASARVRTIDDRVLVDKQFTLPLKSTSKHPPIGEDVEVPDEFLAWLSALYGAVHQVIDDALNPTWAPSLEVLGRRQRDDRPATNDLKEI